LHLIVVLDTVVSNGVAVLFYLIDMYRLFSA
jgi:hypothetical protein